jgi:chromatin assembly factor 1 subunit B
LPSTEKKGKRAALTTVDANTTNAEKEKPKTITGKDSALKQKRLEKGTSPTVYLFARGQLENETPVAHLPGHRTSSIVIKFNPILWNLRDKKGSVQGKEKAIDESNGHTHADMEIDGSGVDAEAAGPNASDGMQLDVPKEASTEPTTGKDGERTPSRPQKSDSPASNGNSIFALKKRSIYAVATHETILIYDTQQSTPICLFGSLHFAAFTDLSW